MLAPTVGISTGHHGKEWQWISWMLCAIIDYGILPSRTTWDVYWTWCEEDFVLPMITVCGKQSLNHLISILNTALVGNNQNSNKHYLTPATNKPCTTGTGWFGLFVCGCAWFGVVVCSMSWLCTKRWYLVRDKFWRVCCTQPVSNLSLPLSNSDCMPVWQGL